jgi:hypothetical protein
MPSYRMTAIAVFLVVAFVLAASTVAQAQCAWLLWQENPNGSGRWKLDTGMQVAFQTQRDCEQQVKDRLQFLARLDPNSKAFLVCLPDTIDPRGPKYGGRWIPPGL